MKAILALVITALALPAHAAILAGPVVNPANGHIYYLLSQNTWSGAEGEAVSLGGHLATIRNAREQRWVFSTFSRYGGALWTGLTDREKVFSFKWTSGETVSYTNWGTGQPDNGTGGVEYYVHLWPAATGSPAPGKWNDYGDADTVLGFPLYGVAEICPASSVRVPLSALANPVRAETIAHLQRVGTNGPELHAFTAIELSWWSETNKLYRVEWTGSLDQPQWENLEPVVSGTGTNVSLFDSTRVHPSGFYRVQAVP